MVDLWLTCILYYSILTENGRFLDWLIVRFGSNALLLGLLSERASYLIWKVPSDREESKIQTCISWCSACTTCSFSQTHTHFDYPGFQIPDIKIFFTSTGCCLWFGIFWFFWHLLYPWTLFYPLFAATACLGSWVLSLTPGLLPLP